MTESSITVCFCLIACYWTKRVQPYCALQFEVDNGSVCLAEFIYTRSADAFNTWPVLNNGQCIFLIVNVYYYVYLFIYLFIKIKIDLLLRYTGHSKKILCNHLCGDFLFKNKSNSSHQRRSSDALFQKHRVLKHLIFVF